VTEDLLDVAWGADGRALTVGRKGCAVESSNDGATWRAIDSGTTEDLRGVSASGRSFVAVGGRGVCLRLANPASLLDK
jgi:photosystem II stability/assembly factor-like uncharacterized protein